MKIIAHHPQNFYPRRAGELIPKVDRVQLAEYAQRRAKVTITPSERQFAKQLDAAGIPYVQQWALRDMDAHKLDKVFDEHTGDYKQLQYWNGFLWLYDFYLPTRDMVIEIDGGSHNHPYQAKQDARKEELLRYHGIGLTRIVNDDVKKGVKFDTLV